MARIKKAVLEMQVAENLTRHLFPDAIHFVENRTPPQPDVVVTLPDQSAIGIEVCALIDESQLEANEHQRRFLLELNAAIDSRPWPLVCVRLVMQDDRDTVNHRPAPGFEGYRLLPRYLDGLFVDLRSPSAGGLKVHLNQWSSRRPPRGLFPLPAEVPAFAEELTQYVAALDESDYRINLEGLPKIHHAVVAEMAGESKVDVTDWAETSLEEKLRGNKYYERSSLTALYLLVHNRSQDPKHDTMIWHDYWHDRERIFDWVRTRVANAKVSPFDAVYFADYSEVFGECRIYKMGP